MFEKPSKIISIEKIIELNENYKKLSTDLVRKEIDKIKEDHGIESNNIYKEETDLESGDTILYTTDSTSGLDINQLKSKLISENIQIKYSVLEDIDIRGKSIKWVD